MPEGIPMSEDERRMRHKMIYGEGAEPPAERTGRNAPEEDRGGRPFGVPRTDEERQARHKELHGEDTEPPAERIGRNPTLDGRTGQYPVIVGEEGGTTKVVYVPQGEVMDRGDLEPISLTAIGAYILAHKMVALVLVASVGLLYGGLKAAQIAYEKIKRRGLPPFQLMIGAPKPEEINDPDAKYTLGVVGAVPGRKVSIKFGKGKYFGYADQVFREGYGDFMVEVTGRTIAEAARKRKMLIGNIPGLGESGDVTVSMYAQEERKPAMRDLTTPIAPVKIHIPGMAERAMDDMASVIPCLRAPKNVSVENATAGCAAGKSYYIKSSLPGFCCLPGLPYTPGMWLPPLCVISETA